MAIKAIEAVYRGYRFNGTELPRPPKREPNKRADCSRRRFGKCIALEPIGVSRNGNYWWGCLCDCGIRFAARSSHLLCGDTKSCGCLKHEIHLKKKLPFGHGARNQLLRQYKKNAKSTGRAWKLADSTFIELVSSNCTYCNAPPKSFLAPSPRGNGGFWYSGIDRIDSAVGYIESNVVPCCWVCNRAKSTLTHSEFISWIDQLTTAHSAKTSHDEVLNAQR